MHPDQLITTIEERNRHIFALLLFYYILLQDIYRYIIKEHKYTAYHSLTSWSFCCLRAKVLPEDGVIDMSTPIESQSRCKTDYCFNATCACKSDQHTFETVRQKYFVKHYYKDKVFNIKRK